MHRLGSMLCQPSDSDSQYPFATEKADRNSGVSSDTDSESHRYFALQPILTLSRRVVGYEALFRAGWEDTFRGDSNAATRVMIDNWLLYGFEDLASGGLVFLNCTREALVSGLLTLLPRWAVFEILETVEPDEEVLRACRRLKKMGYLISLDDFESPEKMRAFLSLADFIKIDFRITGPDERVRLIRRLRQTRAILIAEKIETEEEFKLAAWEGFELFQGYYFRERASFAMAKDLPSQINCMRILETLSGRGFAIKKLMDLISLEPGIGCRLLRRANWEAPQGRPVNTFRDALKLVGKNEFRKLVVLAMLSDAEDWKALPPELRQYCERASLRAHGRPEPTREDNRRKPDLSRSASSLVAGGKLLKMPARIRKNKTQKPKT